MLQTPAINKSADPEFERHGVNYPFSFVALLALFVWVSSIMPYWACHENSILASKLSYLWFVASKITCFFENYVRFQFPSQAYLT